MKIGPLICRANQSDGFCIIETSIMKELNAISFFFIDGALCDLVPGAQFRKRERQPWRSIT